VLVKVRAIKVQGVNLSRRVLSVRAADLAEQSVSESALLWWDEEFPLDSFYRLYYAGRCFDCFCYGYLFYGRTPFADCSRGRALSGTLSCRLNIVVLPPLPLPSPVPMLTIIAYIPVIC